MLRRLRHFLVGGSTAKPNPSNAQFVDLQAIADAFMRPQRPDDRKVRAIELVVKGVARERGPDLAEVWEQLMLRGLLPDQWSPDRFHFEDRWPLSAEGLGAVALYASPLSAAIDLAEEFSSRMAPFQDDLAYDVRVAVLRKSEAEELPGFNALHKGFGGFYRLNDINGLVRRPGEVPGQPRQPLEYVSHHTHPGMQSLLNQSSALRAYAYQQLWPVSLLCEWKALAQLGCRTPEGVHGMPSGVPLASLRSPLEPLVGLLALGFGWGILDPKEPDGSPRLLVIVPEGVWRS